MLFLLVCRKIKTLLLFSCVKQTKSYRKNKRTHSSPVFSAALSRFSATGFGASVVYVYQFLPSNSIIKQYYIFKISYFHKFH